MTIFPQFIALTCMLDCVKVGTGARASTLFEICDHFGRGLVLLFVRLVFFGFFFFGLKRTAFAICYHDSVRISDTELKCIYMNALVLLHFYRSSQTDAHTLLYLWACVDIHVHSTVVDVVL